MEWAGVAWRCVGGRGVVWWLCGPLRVTFSRVSLLGQVKWSYALFFPRIAEALGDILENRSVPGSGTDLGHLESTYDAMGTQEAAVNPSAAVHALCQEPGRLAEVALSAMLDKAARKWQKYVRGGAHDAAASDETEAVGPELEPEAAVEARDSMGTGGATPTGDTLDATRVVDPGDDGGTLGDDDEDPLGGARGVGPAWMPPPPGGHVALQRWGGKAPRGLPPPGAWADPTRSDSADESEDVPAAAAGAVRSRAIVARSSHADAAAMTPPLPPPSPPISTPVAPRAGVCRRWRGLCGCGRGGRVGAVRNVGVRRLVGGCTTPDPLRPRPPRRSPQRSDGDTWWDVQPAGRPRVACFAPG